MKTLLDNTASQVKLDSHGVYQSLKSLATQFESGWHESQFLSLNFEPTYIKNIVFVGMGGSNLPAHIIHSISPLLLRTPFEIVANYRLPQYVDKNTLTILTSYSGNTEEILSCAQDALQKGCPVIVITTGGKLHDIALNQHWPLIQLDGRLNHSCVPRFGLGLLLGSTLGLISRLNQEAFRFVDTKEIIRTIDRSLIALDIDTPTSINPAKQIALKNQGLALVFITANHLNGVGKAAANYINETSKTYSTTFSIPDLNHHLMESLTFPIILKDCTRFILLDSDLYPDIIHKRLLITKNILIKQNYQLTVIKPEAKEIVTQVFESLVFLIMISYYLSIVNKQDPGTNPWVDFFKKELSQ